MASTDPVHVLRGHLGDVQSLAFLSEDRLYAGDSNGELRLWNLASCRTEYTARLHGANEGILHLACLPSYGVLVSQGRDGSVRLWAAGRTGELDRVQPLHEIRTESFNFCRCAIWAPLATAGAGAAAAAAAAAGPSTEPQAAEPRPAAATQGPAGGTAGDLRDLFVMCAGHDPANVSVWRPAEGPAAAVHLRQGNGSAGGTEIKHGMCMALAFLAPASSPALPTSASVSAPSGAASTSGTAGGVGTAPDATDPRIVVAGYEDGVVALWDLRSPGEPLASLRVHGEPVMSLDVRARCRRRAKGGLAARGNGCGHNAAGEGQCTGGGSDAARVPRMGGTTELYDLISGSADEKISCCEVRPAESRPLALAQQLLLREAGTADVRIRPDGKLFACGCWDGRLRLYSLRRREPLAVLKYHRRQVTAVAFSPETMTLASASRDSTIALWSVYSSAATLA